MKKAAVTLAFSVCVLAAFSQGTSVYSFFVNVVNEDFKLPLIGFANTAKGSHSGLQAGFINTNTGDFSGLQAGFVNTTVGSVSGAQVGFVNTAAKEAHGAQVGFVNTAVNEAHGAQVGFVNTAVQGIDGVQVGFVNVARQKISGVQLGFVNYADSIESGIPIGFLSIVRRGGYHAFEYSFSEFYPAAVGFKTGVEKFYASFFLAYNPAHNFTWSGVATGFGVGSIIPVKNAFFFNPELNSLNPLGKNDTQLTSFTPLFGYNFSKHFSITAGLSLTWSHSGGDGELQKPFFKIHNFEIDNNNSIVVGARVGVRYRFFTKR